MPAVHSAIDLFCDEMIRDGKVPYPSKIGRYLEGGVTPDSERCKAGLKGAASCEFGGIHVLDGDHYPWWSFESEGHWEYTADPNAGACDPGLAWGGDIF
ncbi:hypothetical protein ACJZ2D_004272 [Fusarium nematophilum]